MSYESVKIIAVACLFHPNMEPSFAQKYGIVISTEAAHSLIVSSAVEKSASLLQLQPEESPRLAYAVAVACPRRCLFLLSS
jgi:hypothetical protein